MKRVLWISRHQMTSDQRYDLEQVLGDQVVLIRWTQTVETVSRIRILPMIFYQLSGMSPIWKTMI